MEHLIHDLRYALRQLRKAPGFACAAIVILALGIGGTTAIFSTLNPILFEPLPYPHASRIMMIWYADEDGVRSPQAFHTYRELAERNMSFEAVAVMKTWQPTLVGADQPERIDGQQVSAAYFRALGVTPALGRDFQPFDDVFQGPKVVILSDGLWQRRFGGDALVLQHQIKLDDQTYTVIGVMPSTFDNVLAPSAEAWSTLQYNTGNIVSTETREWGHHLRMLGRVRAGVSQKQARSDLAWIAGTPVAEFPRPRWAAMKQGLIADLLQNDITRGVKPALLAVFGAVILVLLIACVNVTNLLLARGTQRRGEIAMRAALGAAPLRLIRQLVTESLLLAIFGGAFRDVSDRGGHRLVSGFESAGTSASECYSSRRCGLCIRIRCNRHHRSGSRADSGTACFPQTPARRIATQFPAHCGRSSTDSPRIRRGGSSLALVLLVSAGLLLHSMRRLFAVSPGFQASGRLTIQVQTYGRKYDDDRVCHQFFAQALDAVRAVPGVTAAVFTSQLPLSGDSDVYGAKFESDDPEVGYPVYRYAVTPGYFEALNIPLRRRRLLDDHDTTNTPPVMLISESLAKRRFPESRSDWETCSCRWTDQLADVHHRGRRRRCEADVAGAGRYRRCLRHHDSMALGGWNLVTHRASPRQRCGIYPRDQERYLVGRPGSADCASRNDGRPARRIGGGAALRPDSVRGFRRGRADASGDGDLWSSVRQRFGANPGNRGSLGAGCLAPWHPRASAASGDDPHRVRHPHRTRRSNGREWRPRHPAVQCSASRSTHVLGSDLDARPGVNDCVRATGMASRAD